MSGKTYKQLRREAKAHQMPYKLVKVFFKRLSKADRVKLLSKESTI